MDLGVHLPQLLDREPEELRAQVWVGSAEHCAELLSRYAQAGCERVYLWPLGYERRQIELVASEVRRVSWRSDDDQGGLQRRGVGGDHDGAGPCCHVRERRRPGR